MKILFFRYIYQSNPEIATITKIYTLSLKFLVMRKLRQKLVFLITLIRIFPYNTIVSWGSLQMLYMVEFARKRALK